MSGCYLPSHSFPECSRHCSYIGRPVASLCVSSCHDKRMPSAFVFEAFIRLFSVIQARIPDMVSCDMKLTYREFELCLKHCEKFGLDWESVIYIGTPYQLETKMTEYMYLRYPDPVDPNIFMEKKRRDGQFEHRGGKRKWKGWR